MNRYTWSSLSEKCLIQVPNLEREFLAEGLWRRLVSTYKHSAWPRPRLDGQHHVPSLRKCVRRGVIRSLIRYCVVSEKMPMCTMARLSSVKLD